MEPTPQSIAAIITTVEEKIHEHGWEVIAVFPVAADQIDFAYTAGLTAKGQPELIVVGLPAEGAQWILNEVARIIVEHGVVDGDRIAGVAAGDGIDLRLRRPVDDRAAELPCSLARAVYGEEVEVAQLVWPDPAGRFPWDDGFAVDAPYLNLKGDAPASDGRRLLPAGPDLTKPVDTPPHFSAVCAVCGDRLDTERVPVYPGHEPWTYLCERDRARPADEGTDG